jgi:DNA invertase Pin-like site-specific DNA recombinase
MTKITVDHLARGAFVYIRQSTPDQLVHNQESQRRQYGLADRAKQLGWATVEIIDDDLGRSGGGIARPGFERLLAAICEARVGAVFAIEASRLARNGRDWHTLIEFCGLVGTVIVDEDGIYDPRYCNDRLLLGMKGTMSELELSLFRQRSNREGPGPAGAGSPQDRIRQVRRASERATGACVAARRRHRAAHRMPQYRGGAQRCLAIATLQHRSQYPDQPRLCRSVCLRTNNEQGQRRGRP